MTPSHFLVTYLVLTCLIVRWVLKMDEPSIFSVRRRIWILRPCDDVGGPAGRGRTSLFLLPGAGNPSYATGKGREGMEERHDRGRGKRGRERRGGIIVAAQAHTPVTIYAPTFIHTSCPICLTSSSLCWTPSSPGDVWLDSTCLKQLVCRRGT